MNYQLALEKLTQLRDLADQLKQASTSSEDRSELSRKMYELYGEVEEVYLQLAGQKRVVVDDRGNKNEFASYFEAGFLSGRTFHRHEGFTELTKVIGKARQRAEDPSVPRDERTVSTVIETVQRFRQCCQYLQDPPANERAVQDILWIMLRSRFDRLDREDSLPRFGAKRYVPDFGIPELRLLVETKYVGDRTRPADIQEEILADVPGYLQDAGPYDSILVVVYDAAHKLRDDRKFTEDLRRVDGILDVVVIPGLR